eukprot:97524-Hanusia_phi.AAC.1
MIGSSDDPMISSAIGVRLVLTQPRIGRLRIRSSSASQSSAGDSADSGRPGPPGRSHRDRTEIRRRRLRADRTRGRTRDPPPGPAADRGRPGICHDRTTTANFPGPGPGGVPGVRS